ncbi:MAG: hypothetical protein HC886_10510 [Leptolyngbyaceae cyanobacterium SM1_1_3]|nr:hypothetical protein [Leptolyngbyaceae cyanobacterium SM1_1_3]NJM85809.1 hypothetical protein [Leptolyngbyaceae cyanobacterium RM2_2_21]NJN03575.1 hypothetical protein [Leptolyngbyaceae cyanobacterium RM1_1_2]NJO11376.1 hypothetical protein [Leptolyngbyaceae cyanobacterium SL_1_1]
MTSFLTANVLLGFLMGLLVALIVYWQQQQRIRKQKTLLQQLQQQSEQRDQTQQQHLSDSSQQLRQSHKAELAQMIEHYQDQLTKRVEQVREEYEARIEVMQLAQSPRVHQPDLDPTDWPDEPDFVTALDGSVEAEPVVESAVVSSEPTAAFVTSEALQTQSALIQTQVTTALQEFQQDFDSQLAEKLKQQQRLLVQQITDFKQAYDGRLRSLRQLIEAKSQAPSPHSNASTEIY